jgi:hypothetical protein
VKRHWVIQWRVPRRRWGEAGVYPFDRRWSDYRHDHDEKWAVEGQMALAEEFHPTMEFRLKRKRV